MSNANAHEEDDRTPGWLQHVLLFIATYIRQLFADQVEQLKARHRHDLPDDWQDLAADLRQSEQLIAAIRAEGARRILAGEPLDIDRLAIEAPDETQPWLAPRTAQQMHLRILAQARFHADPKRYIHRQAHRIRATATTTQQQYCNTATTRQSATDRPRAVRAVVLVVVVIAVVVAAMIRVRNVRPGLPTAATTQQQSRAGQRVRAPPWRPRLPVARCLQPWKPSFRDRLCAPETIPPGPAKAA